MFFPYFFGGCGLVPPDLPIAQSNDYSIIAITLNNTKRIEALEKKVTELEQKLQEKEV